MSRPANNAISVHEDYVAGRLSDIERRAFEERLLGDANLLRDLEVSLRLREGLEVLREQRMLGESVRPRPRAFYRGWTRAAAAALAGVVVCMAFYYAERSPPIVASSVMALHGGAGAPPAVTERYTFAAMRDATLTPELALPWTGALELRALTPVSDASRTFRISVSELGSDKTLRIGSAEHVVPDADGFVVVYADASRLKPGDYWLSVEQDGAGDNGSAERFAFRLKRAGH